VKLTAAKCPSCGANIEVNEKLEKTICQYCGTTVLIEDAIAKLKIELSGKIEVDGIETKKSKLERARKHIKLKEYVDANKILTNLINENKLDEEAYLELLKLKLAVLDDSGFNGESSGKSKHWKDVSEILELYTRICKIDDDRSLRKDIEELEPRVKKYENMIYELEEDELKLEDSKSLLNKVLNIDIKDSDDFKRDINKMFDLVNEKFKFYPTFTERTTYHETLALPTDYYSFSSVKKIGKDGIIVLSYSKISENSPSNPSKIEFTYDSKIKPINMQIVKDLSKECYDEYKEYVLEVENKIKKKKLIKKIRSIALVLICSLIVLYIINIIVKIFKINIFGFFI